MSAMSDPLPLQGQRLLLLEDEFALAVGLADLAVDLGADVIGPVACVADALALIGQLPELDAAILDVNLGRETSFAVADALLARAVPFLFATANDRLALPERFAQVPLCRKPFGVQTFRQALCDCLGASA